MRVDARLEIEAIAVVIRDRDQVSPGRLEKGPSQLQW